MKNQLLTTKKLLFTCFAALCGLSAHAQQDEAKVSYLFTYFTGNAPEEEQICYALSDDGYNYTPLNAGFPVIKSDTIAFTQCVRDPHILRGEDVLYGGDRYAVGSRMEQQPRYGADEEYRPRQLDSLHSQLPYEVS